MSQNLVFLKQCLAINQQEETTRISESIRHQVSNVLNRRGVVIGLSGGIDSSTTAALCVQALGESRVVGLLMPERDSDPDSLRLGKLAADALSIETIVEDIDPVLEALGCYRRRDEAIRSAVPEYGDGHRSKLSITNVLESSGYTFFHLIVEGPDGQQRSIRLPAQAYLGVVAATSFKQRTRKMVEYYHADRLHYAVAGTPNRLEHDQGFFVKNGDGAADLKPIVHLYKTQVYRLAEWLGIPDEILQRPPTTDTFSLPQSQEEFFFSVPYEDLDLCLWGYNHSIDPATVGQASSLTEDQIRSVYKDIERKRNATRYLHLRPQLVEDISLCAPDLADS